MRIISKSSFLAGLRCPKRLWHLANARDTLPPVDPAAQARLEEGHEVGAWARALYPEGVTAGDDHAPLARTVAATQALLQSERPIFEAGFLANGGFARADILVPIGDGTWDLYEVKSGAHVEDEHLWDVAYQAHLAEAAGIRLRRLNLTHVDTDYVRRGGVDPAGLLTTHDVGDEVRSHLSKIPGLLARLQAVIAGPCPDTPLGAQCRRPRPCELWPLCAAFLPEHPVTELTRFGLKAFAQIERGVTDLRDVPAADLTVKQRLQQAVVTSGEPLTDRAALRTWLDGLAYPLHCFDFETAAWAVPRIESTRPHQPVPFQFSLHVIETPGAAPRHVEFLATEPTDPRPALIEAIFAPGAIGPTGHVLAHHASYEQRILRDLARDFPAHAPRLLALTDRFADLETPFLEYWHHHPRQRGRTSIKYVLPALTGRGYEDLAVADGTAAMRAFARAVHGDADPDEKRTILDDLRAYCRRDTEALVEILAALWRLTEEGL